MSGPERWTAQRAADEPSEASVARHAVDYVTSVSQYSSNVTTEAPMNSLLLVLTAGVCAALSAPSSETVTFDTAETEKPPAGWLAGQTGSGRRAGPSLPTQ